MKYIYSAMGWVLEQLYNLLGSIWSPLGNYAVAIIVFTLLVKLVFLPVNINQQKATAKQTAVRPKLDALKERCGDDKQKYNMEMQELYRREGVKLMGGCLPQLITLPFLWGVWMAIRSPLSYILHINSDLISKSMESVATALGKTVSQITELDVIHNVSGLTDPEYAPIVDGVKGMDFNLFGIDLTQTPKFTLRFSELTGADLLLWLIPLASFASAFLSSWITTRMQKKTNPEAAANMGCMMFLMPFMSLYISFIVPGAVGFYWMCSNLLGMLIQALLNKHMSPYRIIARGEVKTVNLRREREKKIIESTEA